MTKTFTSPTEQMRKNEVIMGTQPNLEKLKQLAKEMGDAKTGTKKTLSDIVITLANTYEWQQIETSDESQNENEMVMDENKNDVLSFEQIIKNRIISSGASNSAVVIQNTLNNAKTTNKIKHVLEMERRLVGKL